MNFKIYDILSALIPGFLVLGAFLYIGEISFDKIPVIFLTVFAYLIGYMINSLSSWLESILFFSWGGKPSDKLLKGEGIWKIKFYEYEKVKKMLKKESEKDKPKNDELFQIAMRYAFSSGNQRVNDFNNGFSFSRSVFVSALISLIALSMEYYCDYRFYIISTIILFILWLRAKQRGYYFAREVLSVYLAQKNK